MSVRNYSFGPFSQGGNLPRRTSLLWSVAGAGLLLAICGNSAARAQLLNPGQGNSINGQLDPNGVPAPPSADPEDQEPLLRGPVHEAFAEPYAADPQPGLTVTVQPPAPIEELPPETRPEGDNVLWIPGYWGWDADRNDFVWVSGIWRVAPPNHRWVPGYWNQTPDGYQWIAGTWVRNDAQELEYLAQAPPQTLEQGPVGNAPGDDYFWIPGCWTWGGANYLWRPGYWSLGYQNWTWIPARYCWTPYGYVYSRGYWDYPFDSRGYLFAPYYFPRRSYLNVGFRFSPGVVLSLNLLTNNFWVSPRYNHYYFGDYYGNYNQCGFTPWHQYHYARRGYDPLFTSYQRNYHHQHGGGFGNQPGSFYQQVNNNFKQRVDHADQRPPHTYSDQLARYGKGNFDRKDWDRQNWDGKGDFGGKPGQGGDHHHNNALGASWRDLAAGGQDGNNRPGNPGDDKHSFTRLDDADRQRMQRQVQDFRQLSDQRRESERFGHHGKGDHNLADSGKPGQATRDLKLPGTGDGSKIAGASGTGVQHRFRLPTVEGQKPGSGNFPGGSIGSGKDSSGNNGSGDVSSTIHRHSDAIKQAQERLRDQTRQTGSGFRSGTLPDGNSFGGPNGNSNNSNGNSSKGSGKQQVERADLGRSLLDRPGFEGKTGSDSTLPGTNNSDFVPRTFGGPKNSGKPNGSSSSSSNSAESVQQAIENARRNLNGGGANRGSFRSNGSNDQGSSFEPRSNKSFSPRGDDSTPGFSPPGGVTKRSLTPPSGDVKRSFTTPSTEPKRSFTPPSTELKRSFTPPGNESKRSFTPPSTETKRSFSPPKVEPKRSFSPPSGGGSSVRSFTPSPGDVKRSFTAPKVDTKRSFTPPVESKRSFTPPSTERNRSFTPPKVEPKRSFTPPSGGGESRRSFSKPDTGGGATRSFTPPNGGSNGKSSRERKK